MSERILRVELGREEFFEAYSLAAAIAAIEDYRSYRERLHRGTGVPFEATSVRVRDRGRIVHEEWLPRLPENSPRPEEPTP